MANVDPPGNALFVRLFVSNLHTSRRQTDENRQRTQDGGSRGNETPSAAGAKVARESRLRGTAEALADTRLTRFTYPQNGCGNKEW